MSYQSFDPPQPLDGCERCGMESRTRSAEDFIEALRLCAVAVAEMREAQALARKAVL